MAPTVSIAGQPKLRQVVESRVIRQFGLSAVRVRFSVLLEYILPVAGPSQVIALS